jgi:crotonobetaine/carnitine-CoA ligase
MPLAATHMVGSGSCGLVGPFREAMIADDDGQPVPRGEIGELWLRGPGKMLGYYEKPEATAEVFVDDWFRSGDLFRQDEEGFFYIVGRTKDMVRRNAENVAAREVEEVLRGMPEIKEAAIVAVPDEVTGEEIKAYIQLQSGLSKEDVPPEAVLAFCDGRLAPFKIPRYFEYRESFPMTDSARVEKKKIIAETPDLRLNSYDRVDGVWR